MDWRTRLTTLLLLVLATPALAELSVREAVAQWAGGRPLEQLASELDPDADGWPRVAVLGSRLEVRYQSFRILGRLGDDGVELVVTGYDEGGARLAPAVEPEPRPAFQIPVPAVTEAVPEPSAPQPPVEVHVHVEQPAPTVFAVGSWYPYPVPPIVGRPPRPLPPPALEPTTPGLVSFAGQVPLSDPFGRSNYPRPAWSTRPVER